jgi:hypothetical protein
MITHRLKISNGKITKIFNNGKATLRQVIETLNKQEKIWCAQGDNQWTTKNQQRTTK